MRRFLTTMVLCVCSALAVNVPDVRVPGFSASGRHFAFEETWTADGSGFPFRRLHVVDVPGNTYAERVTLGGEAWEGREAALDAAFGRERDAALRRSAVSGAQPGRVLWRRSLPSPLTYADVPASSRVNVSFAGRALDVRLSEVPATSSCTATAALPPRESVRGLRLTVNGRVLQADARVPASRACAYAYSLEEVRVFADLVVVRVRVFTPGFEGPDAFALVVTGRWR